MKTAMMVLAVFGGLVASAQADLFVSLDGSSPSAQAVSGYQTVTVGKYKFVASGDNYTVTELRLGIGNPDADAVAGVINDLVVRDGSTVLAMVPYDAVTNMFEVAGLNFMVPANTSKTLTVQLDLAWPYTNGHGIGYAGTTQLPTINTTGKDVMTTLNYLKYRDSQGTANSQTLAIASNPTFVYRSVPTFTVGSIPAGQEGNLYTGAQTTLYKYGVSADPAGSVAIKQLKFPTTIADGTGSGVEKLGSFRLFRGSVDVTDSVTIQTESGVSLETGNTVGRGTTNVVVTFDTEGIIPAGMTFGYSLKATPTGFSESLTGHDWVSTYLAGDSMSTAGNTMDAQDKFFLDSTGDGFVQTLNDNVAKMGTGLAANLIWSDESAQIHDYTWNGSSSDWFNGYLLQDLPLDRITVPEPATLILLTGGLLSLLASRRRQS